MPLFTARFLKFGLSALMCASVLFMPDLVWAQTGETNEALRNFSQIAASLVHIGTALSLIIINFMPPVWGSDLITGPAVTEGLRSMWIYVRNLCNIAFVGAILFLALSNMVTSGQGIKDWNIKSKLGPVILGLIAINFSMLAVRVMVDAVHVGTVALLSIADPVITARGVEGIEDYYNMGVDTETYTTCDLAGGGANCKPIRDVINSNFCPNGPSSSPCLFRISPNIDSSAMVNPEKRNIMLAFGFFFMHLEMLPMLSADTGDAFSVFDSTIFSLILGVAYLIALVAIFVVLIVRVVMMWLYVVFSPVLVSSWVMGFSTGELGEQFWKYLLVPVKIAGALAFSMIMLGVVHSMNMPPEYYTTVIEPGPAMKKFWGPEEFGGWMFVWKILTVVLFWKVVFMAMDGLSGVDKIVGGIKGFGEAAGGAALTAGANQVPIGLPGANGETATLASILPGGVYSPNNYLSGFSRSARAGRDFNPVGDTGDRNEVRDALRGFNGRNQNDQRDILNRQGADRLARSIAAAEGAERTNLVETIARRINGFAPAEGATEAQIREDLLTRGRAQGVFETAAPAPAAAAAAATPEVSIDRSGDQITITQGDGSPININRSETTSRAELAPILAGRGLDADRLREIFAELPQTSNRWDGLNEEEFVTEFGS